MVFQIRMHLLVRSMMNRVDSDSPFPPTPSSAIKAAVEGRKTEEGDSEDLAVPQSLINIRPLICRYTKEFPTQLYDHMILTLQYFSLVHFTYDFCGHFDDAYNQVINHIPIWQMKRCTTRSRTASDTLFAITQLGLQRVLREATWA